MCNADYYRRQVIFSVLSNSSHWGKKTGQHFISITKGRREDSIEREPFCQRAMASLFGTVSRGTRINISCLQLLWVGRGKSDSSRQSQEYSQTRSTAPLQARPSLFAQTKWRGRGRSSNRYLIITLISNCNFTVEGEQCLCLTDLGTTFGLRGSEDLTAVKSWEHSLKGGRIKSRSQSQPEAI